jgi:predicted alpha/beta superfamily hydrolase
MKYSSFFLLGILFSIAIQAQTGNQVVIGKTDSVYSHILKEKRKVWVYLPNMKSPSPDASQRYPVVYLLDGDGHFESVVGMIQQLSQVNGNSIVPEMIVVAIPNTDRTRDLTPTHILSDPPMMDSNFSKNTGGGDNFTSFLEKELMPHIDSVYPTQKYKMLIGHSFGGLAVMNVLNNRPKLFNSYIAIDPSMWYDKEQFLKTTTQKLSTQKYDGISLYLGIANTLPEGMTLEKMKQDKTADTRHIRSIFALDKFIKEHPQNGLKYASKYYADDDHSSAPFITEYDGLRFIFNQYRFKFTRGDFMDPGIGIADRLSKHYNNLSKEFGYTISPAEMQVNALGYNALSQKQYAKAAALFEMNIRNYPKSGNVYDSYADMWLAQNDTVKAISNFQKALDVQFNADTKQKLDLLLGKSSFAPTTKDLEKYVGTFQFEGMAMTATSYIKDNLLWASVPGQQPEQLVPASLHVFAVKGKPGERVKFEMDGDKLLGFTFSSPSVTHKASVKKE